MDTPAQSERSEDLGFDNLTLHPVTPSRTCPTVLELGIKDTQRLSSKDAPGITCLDYERKPDSSEANSDAQDNNTRKLAPGQANAMDTKESSKPCPPVLSRFQSLPAEIRQKIYNYVWHKEQHGGHRVIIALFSRDETYHIEPQQYCTDQKHEVDKPEHQDETLRNGHQLAS